MTIAVAGCRLRRPPARACASPVPAEPPPSLRRARRAGAAVHAGPRRGGGHRRLPRPGAGDRRRPTASSVVVVDDGSTDATAAIARRPRVEVVSLAGQPRARRRRAHRARAGASSAAPPPSCSATPTASTRRRRSTTLVGPILAGDGRLRRRQPLPRAHRPHAPAPARRQRAPDRRRCRSSPAGRSPTARAATGPSRRPPPPPPRSIHDYNYAQVLTLDLLAKGFRYRRGADQLPLPHHRPQLRHARSLPAQRRARGLPRAQHA